MIAGIRFPQALEQRRLKIGATEKSMAEDLLRLRLGAQPLHSLLGYLNFSEGKPDVHFQKLLHDAHAALAQSGNGSPSSDLHGALRASLNAAQEAGLPAFRDISQAVGVLEQTFQNVMPAYRQHHRDLLFHLSDAELWQPFLIVRVCEAVLARGPWHETGGSSSGGARSTTRRLPPRRRPGEPGRGGSITRAIRPILYLGSVGVALGVTGTSSAGPSTFCADRAARLADAYFDWSCSTSWRRSARLRLSSGRQAAQLSSANGTRIRWTAKTLSPFHPATSRSKA